MKEAEDKVAWHAVLVRGCHVVNVLYLVQCGGRFKIKLQTNLDLLMEHGIVLPQLQADNFETSAIENRIK